MNEFERKLQSQQLRQVPSAWRERILAEAASPSANAREPQPSSEKEQRSWNWQEWLWPAPQAWGALAAVWILLAALVAWAPDDAPQGVVAAAPPDDAIRAGSLLTWHDAQRVAAELDLLH